MFKLRQTCARGVLPGRSGGCAAPLRYRLVLCALLVACLPVGPAAAAPTPPPPARATATVTATAPAVPRGATSGHSLVRDALPEFLGSLGAGVLLALAGAGVKRFRARRARVEDGAQVEDRSGPVG
ncbi:hypothetical protein GCM10011579_036450 [Streptomyces albiflavescens]|uniref:Uncharacterized protein n=1 Tax=Streptomyces albiflavescens TaxID=1623582 RepID=A0A917Y494_9ACTN|nr:hypothetical protein GCM10011579_036450 [Streptomyces albiflavescens]